MTRAKVKPLTRKQQKAAFDVLLKPRRKPTLSPERVAFLLDLNRLGASRETLCEEIMMTDEEYADALRRLPQTEKRAARNLRRALKAKS